MMRNRIFCILIFTVITTLLNGQASFQEAAVFYEADDLNIAEDLYNRLLSESRDAQSQAAAHFGLGLVYSANKNWGAAASEFRQALSFANIPLELKRDAQIALCEALIHQAQESSNDPALLSFALDLLAEARRNFDESKETHCLLWKKRGGDVCPLASYEGPLLKWLNSVESEVSMLRQTALLHPTSLMDTIWQSRLALTAFKQALIMIQELQNNPSLQKAYDQNYTLKAQLFLDMLDNTERNVPAKMNESFASFRDNIRQMKKSVESNDIPAAQVKLQNAEKILDAWLQKVFPDDATTGGILQLMAYYEMALRSKILPENIVQEIMDIYKSGRFKNISQIDLAQKYAALSLDSLQSNKLVSARIYLEASQIVLSNTLLQTEISLRQTSDILVLVLKVERNITKLTRILAAASGGLAQEKSNLKDIIASAQEEVIGLLKQFPLYARREQKEGFEGSKEHPGRCQHKPWDRVMPLFYSAWEAAEIKTNSYVKLLQSQEKILENLSAALKILFEPIAEGSDSCYTKRSPDKKAEPQKSEPQKDSPQPIETVMRQIQMMEQDDKINKPQSVMKVGEKPW